MVIRIKRCFKQSIKWIFVMFACITVLVIVVNNVDMRNKLHDMQENNSMRIRKDTNKDTLTVKKNVMEGKMDNSNHVEHNDFNEDSEKKKQCDCNNDKSKLNKNIDLSFADVSHVTQKRHSMDNFPYRTINTHAHKYVLDPSAWTQRCSNLSILAYIHTAVTYSHKRKSIRSSWGSKIVQDKLNMKIVFIVGSSKNQTENNAIKTENDKYSDLIQENYIDTYYNITLKAISAMKFIHTYCPNVPLILKTDDDIFVNIPKLTKLLRTDLPRTYINTDKFMVCNKRPAEAPIRYQSKWLILTDEYKYNNYPTYCQGAAYILSSNAVHAILGVANGHEFYKLDDVFLTGILGEKAGLAYIGINKEYHTNVGAPGLARDANRYMFTVQTVDQIAIWWGKHVAAGL